MMQAAAQRVRITFAKDAAVRFISHLDLVRAWERALRRGGLPLAYSQGFNPRPRLFFASAVPVGVTSSSELLDILLAQALADDQIRTALVGQLPAGLRLLALESVPLDSPSLAAKLQAAEYHVVVGDVEPEVVKQRVVRFLGQATVKRTRRRESTTLEYDLRPLVLDLELLDGDWDNVTIRMLLRADQGGTGRPDEVMAALELSPQTDSVKRTRLLFDPGTQGLAER
jgi:radical SAM-linked protein